MLTESIESLRSKAKAATPGPWHFERIAFSDGEFSYERAKGGLIAIREMNFEQPMRAKFDADYIASANPETVLKLLDALDVMGEALKYVHSQPFNGSWDAQAVYLNGVLARAKEII